MEKLILEKLKEEIQEKLKKLKNNGESVSDWTKSINDILYALASENGRDYFHASKFHKKDKADNSEWLYDYLWFTNNKNETLENVHLVAESEWRNQNTQAFEDYYYSVRYDFEKLLVGRVQFKLMIFEGNDDKEIARFIENLKQVINECELPKIKLDTCYMFAAWDCSSQEFIFYETWE